MICQVPSVKEAWMKNEDYNFACEQLVSVRKILELESARDAFSVEVFRDPCEAGIRSQETYSEFSICLAHLMTLYPEVGRQYKLEFLSYNAILHIYTGEVLDMTSTLSRLTKKEKKDQCISFAVRISSVWDQGDYNEFLR